MNSLLRNLAFAACVTAWAAPLAAAQFGMVVGVDDYRHFEPFPPPPGEMSDLEGAVNDATLIGQAMRQAGIDLPPERLLIDSKATVDSFLTQWRNMVRQAQPGDTLIVSFSGHGGQETEVSAPFDEETDGMDETLMFHEFDPKNPRVGRLTDDQLRELLSEAAAFNVIWVMDSCHSAGLTRNVDVANMGLKRGGSTWDIPLDPIENEVQPTKGDDGGDALAHVTQILATASEDRLVTETRFNGKAHGALSWFFAKALGGAADLDKNGSVTRAELSGYLEDRVFTHMNQTQQPRILPRGDSKHAFALDASTPIATTGTPAGPRALPIRLIGQQPPDLVQGTFEVVQTSAALTFEHRGTVWHVLNHTGDPITSLRGGADRQIARALALRDVRAAKRPGVPAVAIQTGQDSSAHSIDDIISYNFAPPQANMPYLTLFNIASNGDLQYLYPLRENLNEALGAGGFPVRFRVSPPVGADQLVAVFCARPPLELQNLLSDLNNQTVPMGDRLRSAMTQVNCQTGITGLFTKEN